MYGDTGKEYYLSTVTKTYSQAATACKNKGGKMAKIISTEMADAFLDAFGKPYMTDLNDKKQGKSQIILSLCKRPPSLLHKFVLKQNRK